MVEEFKNRDENHSQYTDTQIIKLDLSQYTETHIMRLENHSQHTNTHIFKLESLNQGPSE